MGSEMCIRDSRAAALNLPTLDLIRYPPLFCLCFLLCFLLRFSLLMLFQLWGEEHPPLSCVSDGLNDGHAHTPIDPKQCNYGKFHQSALDCQRQQHDQYSATQQSHTNFVLRCPSLFQRGFPRLFIRIFHTRSLFFSRPAQQSPEDAYSPVPLGQPGSKLRTRTPPAPTAWRGPSGR